MIIVLIYSMGIDYAAVDFSSSPTVVGPFDDNDDVTSWLDRVQPLMPNNHFVITSIDSPATFETNIVV